MVTYGFYNSVDHDRTYDATQVSELFDGLIEPGIYNSIGQRFKVEAVSNSFQVRVGTGRAWFNHTWTKNDAPLILNLPAPPNMADRYRSDAIVIDINSDIKVRENKITYVCGEESASENPPHPTLSTGTHTQVPLAYIRRGAKNAKETSIDPLQINYVVGTDDGPPWVAGVLQTADISVYVQRWEDAWDTWFTGKQQSVTDDINAVHTARTNAETSINTDKATFKAFVTEQVSEFTVWMSDKKDGFDAWFANLHYILDGDVAGHLQNEIEDLQDRVVPIEKGGTGNTNGHIQTGYRTSSIYDEPLGLFSTSEGMFCVSSGDGSHAEGGGDYTYEAYDAGIYGDRVLDFNNAFDSSVTGSGSGIDTSYNSNISDYEYAEDENGYQFNSSQTKTGERWRFNSFYFAAVLKNETTGEVLKHDVTNIKTSETKWLPFQKNDTPDYGKITKQEKRAIGATGRKTAGNEDDQPGIATYEGFIVYDDFDNIIYKRNLPPSTGYDPIDPIVINLNVCGVGVTTTSKRFMAFGHISITLTYSKRYNNTYGYDGHIVTTYTIDNLPPDGSEWSQLPTIWIGAKSDPWEGDLTPTTYSDSLCWYMNGTNPFNSNIMVSGSMYVTVGDQSDNGIIAITAKTAYNEKAAYRIPPYIIVKDTTDEYSLKFYYSYSIDNEPDHPLVWREAGESIVVSGYPTRATGKCSHAEGNCTKAAGDYSHAEGAASANYSDDSKNPGAYGFASHIEGYSTWANGRYSHAEGSETKAIGDYSHAEGSECIALTNYTHVEGSNTSAGDPDFSNKGYYAHAEGKDTQAIGSASHAEGINSIAKGDGSHAGGGGIAGLLGQFVHGDFGFGGNKIELTSSKAIAFSDADHDYYLNGCSFVIPSNNWLTIETNRSSQDSSARMLIVIMVDGTNIEIDAIQFLNNDTVAPRKTTIVRNTGASATAFPALDVGVASNVGRIIFLQSSAKRWVQIIRVI